MSDKPYNKINELDKLIRETLPDIMFDGTRLTIEYITGFELFNSRPYHNYETWSSGYRVSGYGIKVEKEDLDDAIKTWCERYKKNKGE